MSAVSNFRKHLQELHKIEKGFVARISAALGTSRSVVNGYLKEENVPSLENAEQVAKALGTSLAEMIGKERPDYAAPAMPPPPSAEDLAIEMVRRFGISGKRLELISFALKAPDAAVGIICRGLPGLNLDATVEKKKGSSRA